MTWNEIMRTVEKIMEQKSVEYLTTLLKETEARCESCGMKYIHLFEEEKRYCYTKDRIESIKRVIVKRKNRLGITT